VTSSTPDTWLRRTMCSGVLSLIHQTLEGLRWMINGVYALTSMGCNVIVNLAFIKIEE